jgi:hypothetical protein
MDGNEPVMLPRRDLASLATLALSGGFFGLEKPRKQMGWKMMEAFFEMRPTCLSDDECDWLVVSALFKHKMNVIEDHHGLLGWKISRRNRAARLSISAKQHPGKENHVLGALAPPEFLVGGFNPSEKY